MKPEGTAYASPPHERWRKVGESVTSHYMNTQRKDVFIDPCECIKKLFDAAKARVEIAGDNDLFGDKRGAAMRTLRGVNHFRAHVKAYEYGKAAEAIYRDTVPGKWRKASEAQLQDFGLESSANLEIIKYEKGSRKKSNFKAHIAIPENLEFCEPMPATLVFKGTTVLEDWLNNAQQGMDMDSDYYRKAVELGVLVKGAPRPVVIAGHSLGGGLAAACAHTCGKDAWTFNAAGLHPNTVERYGEVPLPATIQAYRHEGEVLTAVQEPGWLAQFAMVVVPTVVGLWLGGPSGARVGGWVGKKLVQIPSAPGTKHNLPCSNEEWDGIERHGMSNTLMSFNKMLRDAEAHLRQQAGVQCKQPVII